MSLSHSIGDDSSFLKINFVCNLLASEVTFCRNKCDLCNFRMHVLCTVAKVIGNAVLGKILARLNSSKIIGKRAGKDQKRTIILVELGHVVSLLGLYKMQSRLVKWDHTQI